MGRFTWHLPEFREIRKLNPDFLHLDSGFVIKTNLTFPRDWGLGSSSTLINTGELNIRDPNINIAYNNTSISVDKGVLYNNNVADYGWFGVKTDSNRFTYYSSATNANNIITGVTGDLEIANLYVNNDLSIGGDIDVNCNSLLNVNTLSSCSGDITITSNNIYKSMIQTFLFMVSISL